MMVNSAPTCTRSPASTPLSPGHALFTYGSLMCAEIMAEVVGKQLDSTPAVLTGYRRFLVLDEHYPGVVPDPGGTVAGMVYHGIVETGWTRLDRFEGEMYARRPVSVRLENGIETLVDCYLFRPEFAHRLTAIEWDYAAFLREGKTLFQQQYCGFKAID